MDTEHFNSGLRHLEIMFNSTMPSERKQLYRQTLGEIPNDLWIRGIEKIVATSIFFPSAAQIGEACIPGQAETEDLDKWSGRWVKISTPWPERLARLLHPPLLAPTPSLFPIPGPRDPLSENEWLLLGKPHFKKLILSLEEKIRAQKERRAHPPPPMETEGSPYQRAGHVRTLLDVQSPESQAAEAYWTPERTEARREVLHQQLGWLTQREEAERNGESFTERRPAA